MSDEQEPADTTEEAPAKPKTSGREQIPAHVPPSMRDLFTKHEGSIADRPGFRNKSNVKSKAQKKKRKK